MAYAAITTLSNGNTLTHTHLNTLQADAEFLYAVGAQANHPVPSLHANATAGFDVDNNIWMIRHRCRYLHWQYDVVSGTLDQFRVFYNGTKVCGDEDPSDPNDESGSTDLYDISTWPNYLGAWATSTGYDSDINGDGEIVSNGGSYYKCTADHTSGASTEPGVGADWATVWALLATPTLGTWYEVYVHAKYVSGSNELAVDYLFEDWIAAAA